MAFTPPNSANIASNEQQRNAELTDRAAGLQTVETALTNTSFADGITTLKLVADQIIAAVEAKSYSSGVGAFPNPFNPPGLSNRKP